MSLVLSVTAKHTNESSCLSLHLKITYNECLKCPLLSMSLSLSLDRSIDRSIYLSIFLSFSSLSISRSLSLSISLPLSFPTLSSIALAISLAYSLCLFFSHTPSSLSLSLSLSLFLPPSLSLFFLSNFLFIHIFIVHLSFCFSYACRYSGSGFVLLRVLFLMFRGLFFSTNESIVKNMLEWQVAC